jgi:proline dehydrogenase
VLTRTRSEAGRALRGLFSRRPAAGPGTADAVRVAVELVPAGFQIALEHVPAQEEDATAELTSLVAQVHAAGLAASCELTVPVDRLGVDGALSLGRAATEAGVGVVLAGPAAAVDAVDLPAAGVVVPAGESGAEARCRSLAGRHVRLVPDSGRAAALAFVRCLNVLMAEEGHPGVEVSDRWLIAIAGERAAWNGRPHDSWEYVMPYGVLTHEQRRLVAAGQRVRVAVPSGTGGRS